VLASVPCLARFRLVRFRAWPGSASARFSS